MNKKTNYQASQDNLKDSMLISIIIEERLGFKGAMLNILSCPYSIESFFFIHFKKEIVGTNELLN
jgi:hypothetical protein